MIDIRGRHGCSRVKRNGKDYIMVFGGLYGSAGAATASIEFYDLNSRPSSWESVAGLSLGTPFDLIMGSVVKAFDIGHCDAMIQSSINGLMLMCSGNYSWIRYNLGYASPNGNDPFPLALVDASMFGGKTIW